MNVHWTGEGKEGAMQLLSQVLEGFRGFANPAPPLHRDTLTLGEALPMLVPKVRPRFLYEAAALGAGGAAPVSRPLAGSFALSLAVDSPEWERDLTPKELLRWGADFDGLLQRARANLLLRGGVEHFRQVRPGLFRSTWQDSLDGSRALLPGLLQGLPLRGRPVVALPNRDTLLVAGAEDPGALGWMLEAALEVVREDPHALNGCPLAWNGYLWQAWEAPADHPAQALLARARRCRLLEEYARQKTLLDRLHDRTGRTVAVAPFQLEKTRDGGIATCTILSRSATEGWLPEVDRVGLLGGNPRFSTCLWVPWDEVRRRLGQLMEPMGLFPERYRVRSCADLLAPLLETAPLKAS